MPNSKKSTSRQRKPAELADALALEITAEQDYAPQVEKCAAEVFALAESRYSDAEIQRLKDAFTLARHAHGRQRRKSGEPYIFHPIAVAAIVVGELQLDANTAIAAFLHDVVEDTDFTIDDIQNIFGADVAFLVRVVTKQTKEKYTSTKQVDNFRQLLNSVQYDIRAILLKLADRLHNMRTLESMRPDKQMKIAGETDYFYAPFANRLGFYNAKTELENLSFKFRCRREYETLLDLIEQEQTADAVKIGGFIAEILRILASRGIEAEVRVEYRRPYSIWRKMIKTGNDFHHVRHKRFIDIVFPGDNLTASEEKQRVLEIYSALTDNFKEKPGGIINYLDSPKENGYQSFHLKLLSGLGRWEEIHISSERMIRESQTGIMSDSRGLNIKSWIDKFRMVLRDLASLPQDDGTNFIEEVVTTFYNDDIMTFTPEGKPVVLPKNATALDFAFEIHSELGLHARYVRINNQLATVKEPLHRGDVVEIFTDSSVVPQHEWLHHAVTYKALKAIRSYLAKQPVPLYHLSSCCSPIPGEEVIGFREANGSVTVHKRDCKNVIRLASQYGDSIRSVDFQPDETLYPVKIEILAVDRYHLLIELVECITDTFGLAMDSFNTERSDAIVTCRVRFSVHSCNELQSILSHIGSIDGVDQVKLIDR